MLFETKTHTTGPAVKTSALPPTPRPARERATGGIQE